MCKTRICSGRRLGKEKRNTINYETSIYKISKSHIHNTYCKWVNYGIFKNAFTNFLNKYHLFINKDEAYIDTTTIFNKYGYVNTVGMNTYESKKHKTNKIKKIIND